MLTTFFGEYFIEKKKLSKSVEPSTIIAARIFHIKSNSLNKKILW